MRTFFLTLALGLLVFSGSEGAPKGGKPKMHFDQKQTGDYNIRLNLKDFQIVAFIDNEAFGDLGSYDYNYDYSELTVKPGSVSTTTKTTTTPNSLTSTQPASTTNKEELTPVVIIQEPLLQIKTTTKQPIIEPSTEIKVPETSTSTSKSPETSKPTAPTTIKTKEPITEKPTSISSLTTEKTQETSNDNSPDRIPVFIQSTFLKDGLKDKKSEAPVTNVSIVPAEELGQENNSPPAPLGEIMYYRKCAQGYARDKRGRCRKIRRPQFPFGIARIASNLASKFTPTDLENEETSTSPISDK